VAPGTVSVRLTVNGKSMTQPITVKMDPRVKITPEVQQIFTLTTQMEDNARAAGAAYKDARALADKIKARPQSAANDALSSNRWTRSPRPGPRPVKVAAEAAVAVAVRPLSPRLRPISPTSAPNW
jgi:hypothetical protein